MQPREIFDIAKAKNEEIQAVSLLERANRFIEGGGEENFIYIIDAEHYYARQQLEQGLEDLGKKISQELKNRDEEKLSPQEIILLAYGYEQGLGVEKKPSKAIRLLKKISNENSLALTMQGRLYRKLFDFEQSLLVLRAAYEKKNDLAKRELGLHFSKKNEEFKNVDEATSKKLLEEAGQAEDSVAWFELAVLDYEKFGKIMNPDVFMKSAQLGNLDSISFLGLYYEQKPVIFSREELRWEFLNFAAAAGNKYGLCHLGMAQFRKRNELLSSTKEQLMKAAHSLRLAMQYGNDKAFDEFKKVQDADDIVEIPLPTRDPPGYRFIIEFEKALVFDLKGKMTSLAHKYPVLFDTAIQSESWETIRPLLDEATAKEVLVRKQEQRNYLLGLLSNYMQANDARKIIFAYLYQDLESSNLVGDPVLVQFKQVNDPDYMINAFLSGRWDVWFSVCQLQSLVLKDEILKLIKQPKTDAELLLAGRCYEHGWSVPTDRKVAAECYSRVAEHNVPLGNTMLGILYSEDKKSEAALACLQKAAEEDEPIALYQLSQIKEGSDEGNKYLRRACEANHPDALRRRGYRGLELGRNSLQPKRFFIRAAALGSADALLKIGELYAFGAGRLIPSPIRALEYLNTVLEFSKHSSDPYPFLFGFAIARIYNALAKLYDTKTTGSPESEQIARDDVVAVKYYSLLHDHALFDYRRLEVFLEKIPFPKTENEFTIVYYAALGLGNRERFSQLAKQDPALFKKFLMTKRALELLSLSDLELAKKFTTAPIKKLSLAKKSLFADRKDEIKNDLSSDVQNLILFVSDLQDAETRLTRPSPFHHPVSDRWAGVLNELQQPKSLEHLTDIKQKIVDMLNAGKPANEVVNVSQLDELVRKKAVDRHAP